MEQVRPPVPVGERDDADGDAGGQDQVFGQGSLLGRLGTDAVGRRVGGLDAPGHGAVQHARVRVERAAAAGDPDAADATAGPGVGRHVGAAGGDAEERGGEALDVDEAVAGAEDAEGFAVAGFEGGEEAGLHGGVDGLLEGVIDVCDGGAHV